MGAGGEIGGIMGDGEVDGLAECLLGGVAADATVVQTWTCREERGRQAGSQRRTKTKR